MLCETRMNIGRSSSLVMLFIPRQWTEDQVFVWLTILRPELSNIVGKHVYKLPRRGRKPIGD